MKKTILGLSLLLLPFTAMTAQDVTVSFDLSQPGHRFQPTWGLDQAWISEQNMRKGINHMGKENVGIGRSCFRTVKALVDDSALVNTEISKLRERNRWLNLASDSLPIVLTADQEAGSDSYFVVNKSADVNHWSANINSHVHWLQENSKHPVIGVSPFNEPDYWSVEEGATVDKQVQVAKLLRENYPRLDSTAIVGANTLNDDKAMEWYVSGKTYFDWGNTHQLAGSFDNFAKFYQQLKTDGKVGYADEMHNVGEAMVGLEYGMTVGIWWGFDSRARGEFCDISRHGERLAYGEHRTNWTAASVYRHDDGRVKAFIGSSERQAATTNYQFVSLDRSVYFDGHGPLRTYSMEIPGGKVGSYQNGQTNAERVIDICQGEDVPPTAIDEGVYKLVNKGSGNVAAVSGDNVVMMKYTGNKLQQWNVSLVDPRIGGDYSFYDFRVASNGKTCMDVQNYSCLTNANVIAYTPGNNPTSNQQWYLEYAGDGYYYVRNRESALYLSGSSNSNTNGINIVQRILQTDSTLHACQLWRLLPVGTTYETDAPAMPTGLIATPKSASVCLTWNDNTEEDLDGYMVLRAKVVDGIATEWNTIARHASTPYIDNTVQPGLQYCYKVKAIDLACNQSEPSEATTVTAPSDKAMTAWWPFDGNLCDSTDNQQHATAALSEVEFDADHSQGSNSIFLRKDQYLRLPADLLKGDELTVSLWVNSMSSKSWQRLFDFGHDTDHYLFLTSYNAQSRIALGIKAGGDEQTLASSTRLSLLRWKHVVVTLKPGDATIYLDGEQIAHSDAITIKPSDVGAFINYLGKSQFKSDPIFTGYLDDVRIYNYAFSSDEVMQLFTETSAVERLDADNPSAPATIHSLDGIRRQQPRRGVNIIEGKKIIN
ncbi:MAG: LamG-like jellyroll fold domain-containing protein [Prevotella sp.]